MSPEAAQPLPELFPGNDLATLGLSDGGKQRLLFLGRHVEGLVVFASDYGYDRTFSQGLAF